MQIWHLGDLVILDCLAAAGLDACKKLSGTPFGPQEELDSLLWNPLPGRGGTCVLRPS